MQITACGITLDYQREALSETQLKVLEAFGRQQAWQQVRDQMFAGAAINQSEERAVGHVALRAPVSQKFVVQGENQIPLVYEERTRQAEFTEKVLSGDIVSATGKRYQTLIHIGIGGSELGPRLVCEALATNHPQQLEAYFVANIDAHEINSILKNLDPHVTLVLVASKTFTTRETLLNATIVKQWLQQAHSQAPQQQMLALTATPAQALQWGISADNIFSFWNWVGGRYSLWGAVGLSIRLHLGNAVFDSLLEGAQALDQHFLTNDHLMHNLPALMGHLDYLNRIERKIPTRMLAAYDSRLKLLVAYLQQMQMESLGKSVTVKGEVLAHASCPILWGDVGTNAQHAFFQLLHQGDQTVACELLGVMLADHDYAESHAVLHANLLSQAEVLAHGHDTTQIKKELQGRQSDETVIRRQSRERACRGGHPVSIVWMQQVDAFHLGAYIALWEHRVMVLGCLLNVNPYDQWGVERGKQIARNLEAVLQGVDTTVELLPDTRASVDFWRSFRES